jgi:hypothetical protein
LLKASGRGALIVVFVVSMKPFNTSSFIVLWLG